jgi:hypothetical protein
MQMPARLQQQLMGMLTSMCVVTLTPSGTSSQQRSRTGCEQQPAMGSAQKSLLQQVMLCWVLQLISHQGLEQQQGRALHLAAMGSKCVQTQLTTHYVDPDMQVDAAPIMVQGTS